MRDGRVTDALRNRNRHLELEIPVGFRCCYSHEEVRPGIVCRLMTVSRHRPGSLPSPEAVLALMGLFGFIAKDLACVTVELERFSPGHDAVGVAEPVDGNWAAFRAAMAAPIEGGCL